MEQFTPQHLSMAELEELVGELRQVNERLRTESAQTGKLSNEIQEYLEAASTETPELALLALSQFLTFEHSYSDLAEVLAHRYAGIFNADSALLFLSNGDDIQRVPAPMTDDPASAMLLPGAEAAARQAWDEQTIITSELDGTGKFVALPLTRQGRRQGALTLASHASTGDMPPERWAQLSLFAGLVAVACDNIGRATMMRQHLTALEELVSKRTQQVQSSRDMLRLVFDHMPDGVLLLDNQQQVQAVNQFFSKQLLGRHAREIVGWPYERVRLELEQHGSAIFSPMSDDADYPCWVRCTDTSGEMRLFELVRSTIAPAHSGNHTLELWREHLAKSPQSSNDNA
ncbi:MAG TPA: GAF domain-containing protein [Roseiflexaceae bacterium]|nr:GAF domain-containing protein [Roseiflexaceae bacterium]